MRRIQYYKPIKILSSLVLLIMAAAVVYAFSISITYWTGIGV